MGVSEEKLRWWTAEPLLPEVKSALMRLAEAEDVVRVVAMPDVHLAEKVCVGTVIATTHTLYPAAIGDLGCGMATVLLRGNGIDRQRAAAILSLMRDRIPIVRNRRAGEQSEERARPFPSQELPESLQRTLSHRNLERKKMRVASTQLGTLGRGNHFLELQSDEEGRLWMLVHTGSRGIGQAIQDHHEQNASMRRGGLTGIEATSEQGEAYLSDLTWALDYARANRRRILQVALSILEETCNLSAEGSILDCHHNHVRQEEAGWVHRKGAIAAHLDEPGIIPGSMGAPSYHVLGKGHEPALWSSAHGAGRAMSRAKARRVTTAQALDREMKGVWYDHRLAYRLREESPSAYKDITRVMRAQRALTRIVRMLRPVLVYKSG